MLVRYAEIHFLVRPYRTGDMKLFKCFVYHSEPVQRAFGVSSVYYAVFTAVKRKLQLFRYLYSSANIFTKKPLSIIPVIPSKSEVKSSPKYFLLSARSFSAVAGNFVRYDLSRRSTQPAP